MRTTLKSGLGRSAPFAPRPPRDERRLSMRVYRQPQPPRRSATRRAGRALGWLALALVVIASGLGGGLFLWFHQSLAAVRAHSPALVLAQKGLSTTVAGKPAIALLLGDNQRAGLERSAGGRSDTIMLIRADPTTKTISMLSLPRDLRVPVWCPHESQPRGLTRIDYAFAYCGPAGSLRTVQKLTGLRINYLITVNFHGFKEIVNDIGGIWLDVDRRYYNQNVGTAATDYSNINLQPGYQLLGGGSALAFVRFRHTDSDFYRQARQQEFLRALKDQLAQRLDPLKLPKVVSAITHNVEVGACSRCLSDSTVLGYALFALGLPHGHLLQNYVSGTSAVIVGGADELQPSPDSIPEAVHQFIHPPYAKVAASRPEKKPVVRTPPPPPSRTTVTVLNANGVPGEAGLTSQLLLQHHYVVRTPPNGQLANAPSLDYPRSEIYYDATQGGAQTAAWRLARLVSGADVRPLPGDAEIHALDPRSMLLLLLGRNYAGRLGPAPNRVPAISSATVSAQTTVRRDTTTGAALLRPFLYKAPFRLETPTTLESSSAADTLPGDQPARLYTIAPGHKAVRLVFHTGGGLYWGIEETDLPNPPALANPSFQRTVGGRHFNIYTDNGHIHMVVLIEGGTSYWVINSLLDTLSNKTMLAISEGLRPLSR